MIRPSDATLLALTKLRTRKIRTIITILLASLLFGVLIAISLITTGALRSVASFREDGLTNRYIVSVNANPKSDTLYQIRRNPEMIAEAKKRYESLVEEKKAEAEKLDIRYSQASDQPPYAELMDGTGEALTIRDSNGIVQDLLEGHFKDKPVIDEAHLTDIASQYQAIDRFNLTYRAVLGGSTLETLPNGGEVFYDQSDNAARDENYLPPVIEPYSMIIAPSNLTEPFMLPNNANWTPNDSSIPIILPQDKIETLLTADKLADDADASDKLKHLKELREDAANLTIQTCYRNDASNTLIQQTLQQDKEMKANENDEDYQKPSIIYNLPDPTKCENAYIVSDTRTDDEKTQDANQDIFDRKFNNKTDPKSYFVNFKVVGISPPITNGDQTNPDEVATDISDVIDDLLKTSGIGQMVPQSLYSQIDDTEKEKYTEILNYTPNYFIGNEDDVQRLVEFSNAQDAQKFIDEQGCTTGPEGICRPVDNDYQLRLAFTNSAALDDIEKRVGEMLRYAMLGVAIIAAIIMWIAVGRTITDGRHETAVFRAIGFNRVDIASIYILYTAILVLLIAIMATGIGFASAYTVDQILSPTLTAQAQYGFGGLDMTKEVNLIGHDRQQLSLVLLSCLTTGAIATLIPLISNVRRSPIRDMREG